MKKKFSNCYVIPMEVFIQNYLNIDGPNISNINHYDIDQLNIEGIKRIPNQVVTEDDIETGRVLLVESSGYKHKGKMICAYIRPDLVKSNGRKMSKLDEMIFNSLYSTDCKVLKRKR